MSRAWQALALLLLLAACGARETSPPRNLDDACALAQERPRYMAAMQRTEHRWGVPVPVQMAIIHAESGFRANARTPHQWALGIIPMGRQSSAYGYSQALDSTWNEYRRETGRSRARRDRFEDASDFIGWYANKSLRRNGIPLTDARNQYLAYHEGHRGYGHRTHESKPWLLRVADGVERRAQRYEAQLRACGRR